MTGSDMTLEKLLTHLQRLAEKALCLWPMPADATVRLINVSENATYLVEAGTDFKAVLRIHRENYHTRRAIECELAWLDALSEQNVVTTPGYYKGLDGEAIQSASIDGLDSKRYMVLFHYVQGTVPDESGNLTNSFKELGAIAASCHNHVMGWSRPEPFERLVWDVEAVYGSQPTWGNWRDAPEVDAKVTQVLEQVESTVRNRLADYGKASDRYNLIHADMRLANLLVDDTGTRLIDFDDCGFGWFMYDFAAAISFIEDDPRIPQLKAAWIKGYRKIRKLDPADEAEIDTFIMLRRMALLAWIGSHIEAPEPQAMAPGFAATTAMLGQTYLDNQVDA